MSEPNMWVDLTFVGGGTWTVRADQIVAISDHRWVDGAAPFEKHMGSKVRLVGGQGYGEVAQSRAEVLNILRQAADVAQGGIVWGSTC